MVQKIQENWSAQSLCYRETDRWGHWFWHLFTFLELDKKIVTIHVCAYSTKLEPGGD